MPVAERPYNLTIADFNGDARPDLLICYGTRTSVLVNRGGGNFKAHDVLSLCPSGPLNLQCTIASFGSPQQG
jgi:hypothetical protein